MDSSFSKTNSEKCPNCGGCGMKYKVPCNYCNVIGLVQALESDTDPETEAEDYSDLEERDKRQRGQIEALKLDLEALTETLESARNCGRDAANRNDELHNAARQAKDKATILIGELYIGCSQHISPDSLQHLLSRGQEIVEILAKAVKEE